MKRELREMTRSGPYLITEDWNANMTFLVDSRVIDLRRELHLCELRIDKANKANQGDRFDRVSEMGKKEKEAMISMSIMMSQRSCAKGAQRRSGTRITEGALNGKFSGRSRLK